nr:immunoglobulin heavy chain junction region [Mus musculus]
CTTWGFAYW